MVSLDDAVIARLKTHGLNFEIYVDPDLALSYKQGEQVDLKDVLAAECVFKDASAGDRAAEESMKKALGASDLNAVADVILKKGELHLTTEQKKNMLEARRKQIVSIIVRNAINPQTKTPHPPSRIESAMEEAKVHVTLDKSAKEQVDKILKALQPLIPIRFEKVQVAVKIPAAHTGRLYSVLREYGEVKKEEWVGQEQYCLVEIPGGVQDELYDKLNSLTHGEVKTKLVK
ncbi:MAG: ribosome assembly factor SBDS [Candidatus Altiarchaeales archaeon]|nr:ribosome assembly factor SBDS [Candidatus Altiarchaeales archaeon]